jgi:hypothetical protein
LQRSDGGDQVIKVVCAYCGEVYGAKSDGREAVSISHGACKVCYAIEMKKIDAMKDERITRAA